MGNDENEKNFELKPPNNGKPIKTEPNNDQGGNKKIRGQKESEISDTSSKRNIDQSNTGQGGDDKPPKKGNA